MSLVNIICIFLSLIGMVFISGVFGTNNIEGDAIKGILLGVLSAIFYACLIVSNKFLKDISGNGIAIIQLSIITITFSLYTFVVGVGEIKITTISAISLIILGIFNTGIAYSLYFKAIMGLKTQTVAIYSYIDPIIAILLSTIILKQKMTFMGIIGTILILGSTIANEILEKRKDKIKNGIKRKLANLNMKRFHRYNEL